MMRPDEGPGLCITPVPEETGLRFHEYFMDAKPTLDRVSGKAVRWIPVDDTARGGRLYKSQRDTLLRKKDEQASVRFQKACKEAGGKPDLIGEEYEKFAIEFAVKREWRPCIVLWVPPNGELRAYLRVNPAVLDHPSTKRSFWPVVRDELTTEQLIKYRIDGLFTAESMKGIQGNLDELAARIDQIVERHLGKQTPPIPFVLPPGTSWKDISIHFKDGHTIVVKGPGVRRTLTYTEVGMADGRTKNPNVQWKLLWKFAETEGLLTWSSPHASWRNQKQKEVLAKNLRAIFGIDDQPFHTLADGYGWQTHFRLGLDL